MRASFNPVPVDLPLALIRSYSRTLRRQFKLDAGRNPMRLRYALRSMILLGAFLAYAPVAGADPTSATSAPAAAQRADIAAPKLDGNGQMDADFQKKHDSFLNRRTEGPIDILFLGDSITERWSGSGKEVWEKNYATLNAANFGIDGD